MTETEEQNIIFDSAWSDLKKRFAIYIFMLIGFPTVLVILGYTLSPFLGSIVEAILTGLGLPVWMIGVVISAVYLSRFTCPRCKKFFWFKLFRSNQNPFKIRCVHCGLRLWSKGEDNL